MSSFRPILLPHRDYHCHIEDMCSHFSALIFHGVHIRLSRFHFLLCVFHWLTLLLCTFCLFTIYFKKWAISASNVYSQNTHTCTWINFRQESIPRAELILYLQWVQTRQRSLKLGLSRSWDKELEDLGLEGQLGQLEGFVAHGSALLALLFISGSWATLESKKCKHSKQIMMT